MADIEDKGLTSQNTALSPAAASRGRDVSQDEIDAIELLHDVVRHVSDYGQLDATDRLIDQIETFLSQPAAASEGPVGRAVSNNPSPSLEGQEPVAWKWELLSDDGSGRVIACNITTTFNPMNYWGPRYRVTPLYASPHVPEGDVSLRQVRERTIEECAKVADEHAEPEGDFPSAMAVRATYRVAKRDIASSIRSLKHPPTNIRGE